MYKKVNEAQKIFGVLRQYIHYHIRMGNIKSKKIKEIKYVTYIDVDDEETLKVLKNIKQNGNRSKVHKI